MKAPGAENPDNPFLPLIRHHAEFDVAFLDVEDRVAFGALPEDVGLGLVGRDRSARADRGQERFGVEGFGRDHRANPSSGHFPGCPGFRSRLFSCWYSHSFASVVRRESAELSTLGQFNIAQPRAISRPMGVVS